MKKMMSLVLGLVALGATGCSEELEPGDYLVYRIASAEQNLSDGCYYPDVDASPNLRDDSTSLRSAGTIILYAGPEEQYYLDTGAETLDGVSDGEQDGLEFYAFEGSTVDVEWTDANGTGDRWTTKVHTRIDFGIDGAMVTGESIVTTTTSCDGNTCANVPPKCTSTTEFVGTEVEDVGLEHNVQ